MSILNKYVILKLNSHWVPFAFGTPYQCIASLFSGSMVPINLEYTQDTDDESGYDYDSPLIFEPVDDLEKWCSLEPHDSDLSLNLPNGKKFKVPSVIVAKNYDRIPTSPPKLSKRNIMMRDGNICQYSGNKYSKSDLNIDHVVPKSKGGKTVWTNLVTCHKKINTMKDDMTLEQFLQKYPQYSLMKKPHQPTTFKLNLAQTMSEFNPMWTPFLKNQ